MVAKEMQWLSWQYNMANIFREFASAYADKEGGFSFTYCDVFARFITSCKSMLIKIVYTTGW